MNSTIAKIALATIFIGIALIILMRKFDIGEDETLQLHTEYVPSLTKELSDSLSEDEILVIYILDSEVCPPCITNIIELDNIVDTTENFQGLDVVFIDDNVEDVEKLKIVTDLSLPHKILSDKNILREVNKDMNLLLFVERKTSYVIHSLQIPTKNTSIARKEFTLQEVKDIKALNNKRNN